MPKGKHRKRSGLRRVSKTESEAGKLREVRERESGLTERALVEARKADALIESIGMLRSRIHDEEAESRARLRDEINILTDQLQKLREESRRAKYDIKRFDGLPFSDIGLERIEKMIAEPGEDQPLVLMGVSGAGAKRLTKDQIRAIQRARRVR